MKVFRCMQRSVASLVVLSFCFVCLAAAPAKAAMVGTPEVLQAQSSDLGRLKVKSFLERQDVAKQLRYWGVDPAEAQERVDTMTDAEINMISKKIDQMPAGGDALGFILLVGLVVFVVLLITDIMGVTDVFTFVKKR